MHLRFLEIFCDVAQRRSFSKGAAAHRVSQSSASQAVHLLERRLGVKLIDRSKRPLELTPAGRVYCEGCREMLAKFRAIEDRVRKLHDRVAGPVRVAAIYSVGLMQMELVVQRFETLYPDAQLHLDYLHPEKVYSQVLGDEADLGLVSFPRHNGDLLTVPWQEQPMVLVVSPAHRFASRSEVALSELAGEDYVGFTQDLTIRREVDRWLRRARAGVAIVHEFDNIETIKRAIEIGSGIALLPEPTVWREVSSGTLVAVPVPGTRLVRPLGIVMRRSRQRTTAVQKFIDLLLREQPSAFETPAVAGSNGHAANASAKRRLRAVGAGRAAGKRRSRG